MLDMLISFIADAIAEFMQAAVGALMPMIGFDDTTFYNTFPWAGTAYDILQGTSLTVAFFIAFIHLLPWIFPSSDNAKVNPIRTAWYLVLSVFFIYFGNYILEAIIDLCYYPFNALLLSDATEGGWFNNVNFSGISTVVHDAFIGVSILLYIVVLLLIGISFLKVLLEAVERYLVLFVLVYLSPLVSASIASETTSGIYKKFFVMFLSQCILLILNVWSLKMVISMFANLGVAGNPVLSLLLGYALLRISQKMDSYLNQLGLNAAVTGVGLGGELLAAGMALAHMSRGSSGGGGAFSGGNRILGAAKTLSHGLAKINPISGAGAAAWNATGAFFRSVGESAHAGIQSVGSNTVDKAVKSMMNPAPGGGTAPTPDGGSAPTPGGEPTSPSGDPTVTPPSDTAPPASNDKSVKTPFGVAASTFKDSIGKNMHAAWQKTQDQSALAGAIGKSQTARTVSSALQANNAPKLTDTQRKDLSSYGHNAAAVFRAVDADNKLAINDPVDAAAVMAGTGAEEAEPTIVKNFMNAANSTMDADNIDYTLDRGGFHGTYEKDGKRESLDVVSKAQYDRLSLGEQQGFTKYRSNSGDTYFLRHDSTRISNPNPKPEKPKDKPKK